MKIPKYIGEALKRRLNAAIQLDKADGVITEFIIKNDIEVASEDYCGGVEAYVNPHESAAAIRQAILEK